MTDAAKIPGDKLVLGMLSVLRTLIMELSSTGVLDRDNFVLVIQQIAAAHRETGDPNNLADAIHAISELIAAAPDR